MTVSLVMGAAKGMRGLWREWGVRTAAAGGGGPLLLRVVPPARQHRQHLGLQRLVRHRLVQRQQPVLDEDSGGVVAALGEETAEDLLLRPAA